MRKLFIISVLSLFFVSSCQFVNLRGLNDSNCLDVTKYPKSLILKKIKNPCGLYSILLTVVKIQIRIDKYTAAEYVYWAEKQKELLIKINSVSAKTIKNTISDKITEMNKDAGVIVFAVSDTILEFSDKAIFESDDIKLLILALDNSVDVINNMAR